MTDLPILSCVLRDFQRRIMDACQ